MRERWTEKTRISRSRHAIGCGAHSSMIEFIVSSVFAPENPARTILSR
jgi:hypothetical protein